MSSLPGPLLYLIYQILSEYFPKLSLALFLEKKELSTIIAGFSFTMLGVLAAVITIIFAVIDTESLKRYRRNGYLDLLCNLYIFTVISLVCTAFLSLYGFSSTPFVWMFRVMMMSFSNNLFQVMIIIIIITNITKQASISDE